MEPQPGTTEHPSGEARRPDTGQHADGRNGERMAMNGLNEMQTLSERTAEDARKTVQSGLAVASEQAREMTEKFTRSLGIGSHNSQELAEESRRNLESVSRCGTVITQAAGDISREWVDLSQRQWLRNIDGLQRLAGSRTVHEFTTIQIELMRDGMQHAVKGAHALAERSMRAADEAGKSFTESGYRGLRG